MRRREILEGNPMRTQMMLISLLALSLLMAGCTVNPPSQAGAAPPAANQSQPQAAAPQPQSPQAGGSAQRMKLSDTQYWNYAYLISGPSLDSNAQAALAGFNYSREVLPDGSENITLIALEPQYKGGSFIVKPGQKLFFIETTFGDDAGSGEYNMGDDSAVLVDQDGYVVPIPQ